jgi:hypothetical protein
MRRKSWGSAFVRYEISCESIEKVSDPVRSPEGHKSGKNCRPANLFGGGKGQTEGHRRGERKPIDVARGRAHGYHSGTRAGIMVAMMACRGWKGV